MELRKLLLNLRYCKFLCDGRILEEPIIHVDVMKDKSCDCLSVFTNNFVFELNLDDLERDSVNNYDGVFCMKRGDNRVVQLVSLLNMNGMPLFDDFDYYNEA